MVHNKVKNLVNKFTKWLYKPVKVKERDILMDIFYSLKAKVLGFNANIDLSLLSLGLIFAVVAVNESFFYDIFVSLGKVDKEFTIFMLSQYVGASIATIVVNVIFIIVFFSIAIFLFIWAFLIVATPLERMLTKQETISYGLMILGAAITMNETALGMVIIGIFSIPFFAASFINKSYKQLNLFDFGLAAVIILFSLNVKYFGLAEWILAAVLLKVVFVGALYQFAMKIESYDKVNNYMGISVFLFGLLRKIILRH